VTNYLKKLPDKFLEPNRFSGKKIMIPMKSNYEKEDSFRCDIVPSAPMDQKYFVKLLTKWNGEVIYCL
jgi:translation initiation factor 2 beta subunit (eIF-2beta)/eIF-5